MNTAGRVLDPTRCCKRKPNRVTISRMSQDLPVIYHAFDVAEADMLVNWLADRGIEAVVKDRFAAGTMEVRQIVAPAGIEVCALNPEEAETAREQLAEHFEQREANQAAKSQDPVDATCEDCGKTATYPADQRGRVERCLHCFAYIDVPE